MMMSAPFMKLFYAVLSCLVRSKQTKKITSNSSHLRQTIVNDGNGLIKNRDGFSVKSSGF